MKDLKYVQEHSTYDIAAELEKYQQRIPKSLPERIIALDEGRGGKSVVLSKIFQKAFDIRGKANGKFRQHAFLLEEMAKQLLDGDQKLVLIPSSTLERDVGGSAVSGINSKLPDEQQIRSVRNMDKILSFLVSMSGSTTLYDSYQRQEILTPISKKYLQQKLMEEQNDRVASGDRATPFLQQQLETVSLTNLFQEQPSNFCLPPTDIQTSYSNPFDHGNQFFTEFSGATFYNPNLERQMALTLKQEQQQKKLIDRLAPDAKVPEMTEFQKLVSSDMSVLNRFTAPFFGIKTQLEMQLEQDIKADRPTAKIEKAIEPCLSAFSNQKGNEPFEMQQPLFLPPLPSLTTTFQLDPNDPTKGGKLVTRTFFSFGDDQNLSQKEQKAVASFFRQTPSGQLEEQDMPPPSSRRSMDTNTKEAYSKVSKAVGPSNPLIHTLTAEFNPGASPAVKLAKRVTKNIAKQQEKQENLNLTDNQRRSLLLNLFAYVDESKLRNNVASQSGILPFWEDEFHPVDPRNDMRLNETGLLTHQKLDSFYRHLSQFQNSILQTRDPETGKLSESVLTEGQLISKSLLLLQGIPSSGVFELDHDNFTFSLNGNRRVYLERPCGVVEGGYVINEPVQLRLNQALFTEMMEAGSYFLHLKEFVNCMQNVNATEEAEFGVGLILQAFSLSVAEFLSYYQSQVLQFENKVRRRRQVEDCLLFDGVQTHHGDTLLELKVHMNPLLTKLRLLATICFTQKFIDDIDLMQQENREREIQERQEEGYEKFQNLLYGKQGQTKFDKRYLQFEFQKNLEKIRNNQWLQSFPRGAALLTYLYKILMCCESEFQAAQMLRDIFATTMQPLLVMINDFIYTGCFNDPYKEFFIEQLVQKKKGALAVYKLTSDSSKIPSFLGDKMALAIFKVGSHVSLLESIDDIQPKKSLDQKFILIEKLEQVGKKEYYNICNLQSFKILSSCSAMKEFSDTSPQLRLTFDINQLKNELALRQSLYRTQVMELHNIEQAIVTSERIQFQNILLVKQQLAEQFMAERHARIRAIRLKRIQRQEQEMDLIRHNMKEALLKREVEQNLLDQQLRLEKIEREEVEQIKAAIANELKKQYLALVEGENQTLGDVRDKDIIDQENLNKELEIIILEAELKRQELLARIYEQDQASKVQVRLDIAQNIPMAVDRKPSAYHRADVSNYNQEMKDTSSLKFGSSLAPVSEKDEEEVDIEDIRLSYADLTESDKEIRKFIQDDLLSKCVLDRVFERLEEKAKMERKMNELNIDDQQRKIEQAKEQRKLNRAAFTNQGQSIRNRLNSIIEESTTEAEKEQIRNQEQGGDVQMRLEEGEETTIVEVPVHLAINQCVIAAIKDQFKLVNKCMLHMMFRKLNLIMHLKALRVFYLAKEADITEAFCGQLFHDNQECTLKDNSLYFLNNCFDYAVNILRTSQEQSLFDKKVEDKSGTFLFKNIDLFAQNLSFTFKKQASQARYLLNLHNMESAVHLLYFVTYPLNLVITDNCLDKYNRIFFTVLKVKKVIGMLKDCWKVLNGREFRTMKAQFLPKARAVQALRSNMHSFMITFEQYLMIDAIDSQWLLFYKKLIKVQVFEELVQLHNSMLDKILDLTMIGRKETKISEFIQQIFICIQKYCVLVNDFREDMVVSFQAFQDFETLKSQFDEQRDFFIKFVQQLASKGHYRELNSRLN